MGKSEGRNPGSKDRSYVNKSEKHEVSYEKHFGKGKD